MTRLITIILLIAIAFMFIRYRTNEKLQKGVVVSLLTAFVIYAASIVITELTR